MRAKERSTIGGAAALWRAEAVLLHRRRDALAELERCFASGSPPEGLDGPLDGRVVTTTIGSGLDPLFEALSRAWMPWKGKVFAPEASDGRNRFAASARPFIRGLWPGYGDIEPDAGGFTAFRFETGIGPSATNLGVNVLRIDYASSGCPWPVRLILDELVHVGDGQHLGQALVRWRGRLRRAAWFALGAGGTAES